MIDTERNPSPEEAGFKPSEFKFPDEQEEEIQQEREVQQSEAGEAKQENDKGVSAELSPQEKEAATEIEKQVIEGFSMLYDMLPHSGEVDEKKILKILNTIKPLRSMTIPPREAIAGIIEHDDLHLEEKEDFIMELRSVPMVDLWMHAEALSKGADKSIEELKQSQEHETTQSS